MRKKPRILMIDNDPYYCMVMRVALEADGFSEVFYENKANVAIPAAEEIQPDIILLDVVMREKNGLQILGELKSNGATAHITVIILTALASDDARAESSRHFSEYYMEKYENTNELKIKIRDLPKVSETFETERPDVVIVDIALRKVEGSDIISRVKGSKIKTKIIVITSIGEAPIVRDLIEHGADDILIKPYSIEQLYAMIIKNLMS